MKNLKIYKSALAFATATSIFLLSGCISSNSNNDNKEKTKNKEELCTHLTVYFEDKPVTFKECEGYDVSTKRFGSSSEIEYDIEKDGKDIISGITTNYNNYHAYHSVADEILNQESVQKTK